MTIYGVYDVVLYWVNEGTFNVIPSTPSFNWSGTVQEATWNNNPHVKKVFAINNTRTLSSLFYTKKEFTYKTTYFPVDTGLFGTAFIPSNNNANSITFEEAWKPLYGAGSDTKYVRFTGGKTDKVKVAYKIGEPLEIQQDFVFANQPTGNPYATPIAGASYASEPNTGPFLFSDQNITIDGTQVYPIELEFDLDNKLQYDPHGYFIGAGGDKMRASPPGYQPLMGSVTANWEDWTRLTDIINEVNHTVVFPFGPSNTITLNYVKWDSLELQKQVSKDIVAPKVPFTCKTAVLA